MSGKPIHSAEATLTSGPPPVAAEELWNQPGALHQCLDEFSRYGVMVTDTQLTIRHWNHWLAERSSLPADRACGQPLFEVMSELATRGLHPLFQRALNGETAILSQRLHRYLLPLAAGSGKDPSVRMLQSARIAPLRRDGQIIGTVTVIEDVTERVTREQELQQRIAVQESLTEISQSILTLNLAECLQGLVNDSAGLLGADLVAVVLNEEGGLRLGACTGNSAAGEALRIHEAGNVAARVLASKQKLRIQDAPSVPESNLALDPRSQSVLAAPLMAGSHVIGVLVAESGRAAVFSDAEESLLLALAQHAAVAIQNARLFETSSKSEERFRLLSASAPIGIFETDAAGGCLYTNPEWQRIAGLSLAESLGDGWQRGLHPDDTAEVFAAWQSAAIEGRPFDREFRFRTPAGDIRWVHSRSIATRSETSAVLGYVGTVEDITEGKRAEAELAGVHRELLEISRQAGQAEVATSVLHNVGNVLNSVNVSANLVSDQVRKAPVADLGRVVALLREQGANLGAFFTSDPRGPKVADFLAQLADKFTRQQEKQLKEVAALQKNIEHIKDIVAMQQSYAKVSGLTENLSPVELIEDALRMNSGSFEKHEVELVRELPADLPRVCVDKHKVLQILVNLLRNAKHACDDAGRPDKRITVRAVNENGRVRITIADNGVGIPPENLNRIFNHGFTTKKTGHGFGLHSAANAAKGMGGSLTAHSDGPGRGAAFTLELLAEARRELSAPPPGLTSGPSSLNSGAQDSKAIFDA